jgi:hypothetical protein
VDKYTVETKTTTTQTKDMGQEVNGWEKNVRAAV